VSAGKVYLIGAGPGDPGLITMRGARALGLADVVLYDALAHPALLQHARPDAELRSVGKRYGEHSFSQDAINAELVQLARAGKVVARLKGGDPMLFARGAEEVETLAEAHIPFEIIPGITSSIGAAAYAGISLTHRDLSSSVAFITGTESPGKERTAHDWSKLATATQTLCVIMGMKRLGEITSALIAHGRDPSTPVAVVHWGTWWRQQVVEGTVADICERVERAGVANPSVVIIGEVARLRQQMRWFDTKPLFGKRVLITRPAHQAEETARDVRERGGEPVMVPAITIAAPPDHARFARAVTELDAYDMVAFTSANGATRTMTELRRLGRDARAFGRARVAAIGPGTAQALAAFGISADVVAKEFVGEGLAAGVLDALGTDRPKRVLLLRALVAREVFGRASQHRGPGERSGGRQHRRGDVRVELDRPRDLHRAGGRRSGAPWQSDGGGHRPRDGCDGGRARRARRRHGVELHDVRVARRGRSTFRALMASRPCSPVSSTRPALDRS